MFTPSWDRDIPFFTTSVENKLPLLSIGRCHAKGRGRRVRMSSSGDRRKLRKSRAPTTAQEHLVNLLYRRIENRLHVDVGQSSLDYVTKGTSEGEPMALTFKRRAP